MGTDDAMDLDCCEILDNDDDKMDKKEKDKWNRENGFNLEDSITEKDLGDVWKREREKGMQKLLEIKKDLNNLKSSIHDQFIDKDDSDSTGIVRIEPFNSCTGGSDANEKTISLLKPCTYKT